MRRIGIMGGTFDPIHFGHLMLGKQAFKEYELDEVWYMPTRQPPHKAGHRVTSSDERFAMVKLAIKDIPYFRLSDFELKRMQGNTYTADTLRLLKETYRDTEFFFIVGADSLFDIEKWYHPAQVLKLSTFLIAEREFGNREKTLEEQVDYLEEKYHARILRLHSKEMDISSEEIRQAIQVGHSVESLIPDSVYAYIKENNLYR